MNDTNSSQAQPSDKDVAGKLTDNEKKEMASQVSTRASGDYLSHLQAQSHIPVTAKNDTNKLPSPRNPENTGGSRKKKSWYSAFYPTYKSKSEDFKRLFKDLPDDERLIVDYSSAIQREMLAHGRMYASQNYLCFYAYIFGWETSVTIKWKDVTAITKEKTALVIPNAITVHTASEKHFFTSFTRRDKAYLMLFRIWQNALMDQPMSSQEIWQWVHSCYGDELGFNSDDECYPRELNPIYKQDESQQKLNVSEDLTESSVDLNADIGKEDQNLIPTALSMDPAISRVTNGNGTCTEEDDRRMHTDMSDSDSLEEKYVAVEMGRCTSKHEGKILLQQEFQLDVDQLFTMLFTNSKFYVDMLTVRGGFNYIQKLWTEDEETGEKYRVISYTLPLTSNPMGPKEVHICEHQLMNKCSKPGVMYSIDCRSENRGVPYADFFTVNVHYCLRAVTSRVCALTLYAHVQYKKQPNFIFKRLLENSTISGLEAYVKLLISRLSKEEVVVPVQRKIRRRRRATGVTGSHTSNVEIATGGISTPSAVHPTQVTVRCATSSWLLLVLLLLLILNATLCWQLYRTTPSDSLYVEQLNQRLHSLIDGGISEWSRLIKEYSHAQRDQLVVWKQAIDHTVHNLQQIEKALSDFLNTMKLQQNINYEHNGEETTPHQEL